MNIYHEYQELTKNKNIVNHSYLIYRIEKVKNIVNHSCLFIIFLFITSNSIHNELICKFTESIHTK